MRSLKILAIGLVALWPSLALAQATNLALSGFEFDGSAAIEVTADSLSVDQNTGVATFVGNVIIGQGTIRLSAGEVRVEYSDDTGAIARFIATGGITFVTENEAAEAESADYDLTTGILVLSGSVLLTMGPSALSADTMTVSLNDGTARLEGNVRTVLAPGGN